jgi:UDP-N-acetylglucosamine--N-acetylmuramyl-(pentapeptide) pyrophosphoryl-undecaprenol N-acetylglucosamine transferase
MSTAKPWFVIAGGGTGGHLYPGLAVAGSLRRLQPDFEVSVFGTGRALDAKLIGSAGYELVSQEVRPFPKKPWQWPGFLAAWRRSVRYATDRFVVRPPAAVLGLGGYASAPAIMAASKIGIPTAIFNPDAEPGRANRRLARRARRVFVQWRETAERFGGHDDIRVVGCPVRPEFARATRQSGCRALRIDEARPTVLITGASQGARSINAACLELIELWRVASDWQVVHVTGDVDFDRCRAAYKSAGITARTSRYTEHMALCMAAADIVISRAGASTLAEITAMSLPSVLMPYPFDRAHHQMSNARILAEAGAAEIVEDHNDPRDDAERLRDVLRDLMKSPHRRERMAKAAGAIGTTTAADTIAEQIFEMAGRSAGVR